MWLGPEMTFDLILTQRVCLEQVIAGVGGTEGVRVSEQGSVWDFRRHLWLNLSNNNSSNQYLLSID